jgi:hypothetical protein
MKCARGSRLRGNRCMWSGHRNRRLFRRRLRRLLHRNDGSPFCFGSALQLVADLFGYFDRDRTGVSFFLGNAKARQQVDNRFCLDLELSGQFVNSHLG